MNTIKIDYDLNKPGKDYGELITKIKTFTWCHVLKSSWLIRTSLSASQVLDALLPYADTTDDLLVVNVTGDAWASYGLSQDINNWLKQHV